MSVTQTFPSRYSLWIFIPTALLMVFIIATPLIWTRWSSFAGLSVIFGVIYLPILFNTKYTISGNVLNVKCGFLVNKNIDIASIRKIAATRSILSAPALSITNRIEVFYNKYDSVVISPRNIPEFTKALKQINADISIEL